jgi:hypothetical protein
LENLNEDYDSLCDLSAYLTIDPPSENDWQSRARKPLNRGQMDSIDWTNYHEEHFQQIAGRIQEELYA